MSVKKVLITAEVHPYLPGRFCELGWEVTMREDVPRQQLLNIIHEYSVLIITTYLKADRELLDKAENLRIIGRAGSGLENVDLEYCRQKKVLCFNSPEGNANAVGEHTLALLLNLMHKINVSAGELKNGIWQREKNRGIELSRKTVGIIGFGHTGNAFAKKLSGFDVRILAFDPYIKRTDSSVQQTSLERIQQECDIISFHVPYNQETHHYINTGFIRQCLKKPILLNTSRGAVANTLAVLEALKNEQISGYGTDVYEDEPVSIQKVHPEAVYQQLFSYKNVLATPHIAGWTVESKYLLVKILMDKIEPFLTF